MERKAVGESRLESQLIQKRLMQVQEGDVVSYSALNDASGVNVQNGGRVYLKTARKNAEVELRCVFSTVRGVGLKRMPPDESHSEISRHTDHIRRSAKRAFKRSAWSRRGRSGLVRSWRD